MKQTDYSHNYNKPTRKRSNYGESHLGYMIKLVAILLFVSCDLGIHSMTDMFDSSIWNSQTLKNTTVNIHYNITTHGGHNDSIKNFETENDKSMTSTQLIMDLKRIKNKQIFLSGSQILCQICILAVIFLLLCDTIPFQVGLVGIFFRQDRQRDISLKTSNQNEHEENLESCINISSFLKVYMIYLFLTCAVGAFRVVRTSLRISEAI